MSAASGPQTIIVSVPLEEDEPLGARPNDGLVITEVQDESPASGRLQVGDTIISVNGRRIPDLKAFYNIMRIAHPEARIEVKRPRSQEELPTEVRPDPSDNLPAEIKGAIRRRPGYHYSLVSVDRVRGLRFGLAIKTRDNRVLVTEVQPGSMCSPHLQIYDHVVYVSGVRVTQAEVAQTLLIKGLKEKNRVDCVVGRPTSEQAIIAARILLSREDAHDPPSVRLNLDVQQVMRQQIVNMAGLSQLTPKPILVAGKTPTQPANRHISFTGQDQVVAIQSDHVGRQLRVVTTGIPNSPIRQQQRR